MNYQALLYNPIYLMQGVPATITFRDSSTLDVTVLDKTAALKSANSDIVSTVLPAACMRVKELLDDQRTVRDLDRAELLSERLRVEGNRL
jgi:hypothetical protein